jgi:hypothetical protein
MKSESRVVCRLGARDELPYFQAVKSALGRSWAATVAAAATTAAAAKTNERKWTNLMTDQPLW